MSCGFNSCIENREERDGKGRVYIGYMRRLVIQLHFLEYKLRAKQVQISHDICTPEDRLDRFSRNAQAMNWIKVTKTTIWRVG